MIRPYLKAINYILGLEAFVVQEFEMQDIDSWQDLLDLLSMDEMLKDQYYDLSAVKDCIDQITIVVNKTLKIALQRNEEGGDYEDMDAIDEGELRERFNEITDLLTTARSTLDDGNFPLLAEVRVVEEVNEASKLFNDLASAKLASPNVESASKMLTEIAQLREHAKDLEREALQEVKEASDRLDALFAKDADPIIEPTSVDANIVSQTLAEFGAFREGHANDSIAQAQLALNMLAIAKRHGVSIPT
jgi:hypothetical protein